VRGLHVWRPNSGLAVVVVCLSVRCLPAAEEARGQDAEILAYVKGDQGELMQRKERTRAVDVAARAGAVGGVARARVRGAGCEQP
jgi:hypothetical protein